MDDGLPESDGHCEDRAGGGLQEQGLHLSIPGKGSHHQTMKHKYLAYSRVSLISASTVLL